jgi:hypothetical protein
MQPVSEQALQRAISGVFTRLEAAYWAGNDGARLDALLKRAVAAKEILRIRRGLFCLAERYLRRRVHPFELAQQVHGPSYISLETALAHHGWIPEAAYAITCATQSRSRSFDTPLGLFSYMRIPQSLFFAGVSRVALEGGGSCLLAAPLKALADYVYVHACDWRSAEPVMGSLRVDETCLEGVSAEAFEELKGVYASGRVNRFLAGLRKDLKR